MCNVTLYFSIHTNLSQNNMFVCVYLIMPHLLFLCVNRVNCTSDDDGNYAVAIKILKRIDGGNGVMVWKKSRFESRFETEKRFIGSSSMTLYVDEQKSSASPSNFQLQSIDSWKSDELIATAPEGRCDRVITGAVPCRRLKAWLSYISFSKIK